MGLELVIFIVAILFGIFLYWRESNGNAAYRFLNRIVNSKELQMAADNPKGFVFQQGFIPRLIFVVSFFLILALIIEFLTPISVFGSYNGVSAFSSIAAGTLLGTYIAHFVIRSSKAIDKQSDSLSDYVENTFEKGKEYIEDLKTKDAEVVEKAKEEIETEAKSEEKSARERLKDKGLM